MPEISLQTAKSCSHPQLLDRMAASRLNRCASLSCCRRSAGPPVIPSPRPAGLDRNSSESCDLAITATGGKRLSNGCRLLNSQAIDA